MNEKESESDIGSENESDSESEEGGGRREEVMMMRRTGCARKTRTPHLGCGEKMTLDSI